MDEVAFWDAIEAAPDDDLPKLVFADRLDELGDPRSACLRWLVAENKRPAFDEIDTKTWDWWSRPPAQPIHYDVAPRQYVIPANLFIRLLPPGTGLWKGHPTYLIAIESVCAAWRECLDDGVDPLRDDAPLLSEPEA
jgi:uncharacterized protein (TIGR02996 family)